MRRRFRITSKPVRDVGCFFARDSDRPPVKRRPIDYPRWALPDLSRRRLWVADKLVEIVRAIWLFLAPDDGPNVVTQHYLLAIVESYSDQGLRPLIEGLRQGNIVNIDPNCSILSRCQLLEGRQSHLPRHIPLKR